jgi:hypothetical protein
LNIIKQINIICFKKKNLVLATKSWKEKLIERSTINVIIFLCLFNKRHLISKWYHTNILKYWNHFFFSNQVFSSFPHVWLLLLLKVKFLFNFSYNSNILKFRASPFQQPRSRKCFEQTKKVKKKNSYKFQMTIFNNMGDVVYGVSAFLHIYNRFFFLLLILYFIFISFMKNIVCIYDLKEVRKKKYNYNQTGFDLNVSLGIFRFLKWKI